MAKWRARATAERRPSSDSTDNSLIELMWHYRGDLKYAPVNEKKKKIEIDDPLGLWQTHRIKLREIQMYFPALRGRGMGPGRL